MVVRPIELGDRDVVVADDRQVARGPARPRSRAAADDAERLRVARGEDGRRRCRSGEEPNRQLSSLIPAMCAQGDEGGSDRDARLPECALVAGKPLATGGEPERILKLVADIRDPRVTKTQQVLRREFAAASVISRYSRQDPQVRRQRVDHDNGHRGGRQPGEVLGPRRERDDEEAIRPLRSREIRQVVVPLLDRLDVVDDKVERAVAENNVDAAETFCGLRSR